MKTRSLVASTPPRGRADAAALLPGWLRRPPPGRARARAYTAEEVLQRLRSIDSDDPRTAAVQSAVSQTAAWPALLPESTARDLGPAASRLPTVVFWYGRGADFADIGRRLSPLGGAWDGQRAVVAACRLVAQLLNRTRAHSSATGRWTSGNMEQL